MKTNTRNACSVNRANSPESAKININKLVAPSTQCVDSHGMANTEKSVTGEGNAPRVWVVTAPSAYRTMHTCFLGRGATKQAALEDAYGPKESWGNATRKSLRIADVYETDKATADDLEFNANS